VKRSFDLDADDVANRASAETIAGHDEAQRVVWIARARCTSNPRNGWVGSMNATGSKPCESPWALRCNSHCNIGPVREKDAFDCALAGNKQRRGSSAAAQLLGFGLQSAAGTGAHRLEWRRCGARPSI